MRKILFFFSYFVPFILSAQVPKFKVLEKLVLSGDFIVLIEYNDSIIWENNKILYAFCVPKDSLQFNSISINKNAGLKFYDGKIENFILLNKFDYYGLFYDYLFKYPKYAYQKNNLDSGFKKDMSETYLSLLKDTFDFFSAPFLPKVNSYGLYLKSTKITIEAYLVSYENFKQYRDDFLSTTNDIRNRNLVGIRGSFLGASLFNIQRESKAYKVIIPLKVRKTD